MRGFENFGFILAPRALVNRKLKIGWMYREPPETAGDSGWRVFTGDEDEAEMDNGSYFGFYDVKTILEIDPSVENCLHSPECTAFIRDESGKLVPAKYDPPTEE